MQCALDSCPIVLCKCADAVNRIIEVFSRNRRIGDVDGAVWKAGFSRPAEIHDDLDEILQVSLTMQRVTNVWWHDA